LAWRAAGPFPRLARVARFGTGTACEVADTDDAGGFGVCVETEAGAGASTFGRTLRILAAGAVLLPGARAVEGKGETALGD
jgi:hypothetical protein